MPKNIPIPAEIRAVTKLNTGYGSESRLVKV